MESTIFGALLTVTLTGLVDISKNRSRDWVIVYSMSVRLPSVALVPLMSVEISNKIPYGVKRDILRTEGKDHYQVGDE